MTPLSAIPRLTLPATLLFLFACTPPTPKPFGHIRIEPPDAAYLPLPDTTLPFTFLISGAAEIVTAGAAEQRPSDLTITYPDYNATLHCNYLNYPRQLPEAEAESRRLVVLHTVERFSEHTFTDTSAAVYATLFLLDGNTPTPIRFHVTDSAGRFFRAALLYAVPPNADSLAPVTAFLTTDILHLIQSFRWR